MASLTELQDALMNAHRAGDAGAASALADEIVRQQKQSSAATLPDLDPTTGMAWWEKLAAGNSAGVKNVYLSGQQLANTLGRYGLLAGPPLPKQYADAVDQQLMQQVGEKRRLEAPLDKTTEGMIGKAVGETLPALAVPFGTSARVAGAVIPGRVGAAVAGSNLADAALTGALQAGLLNPVSADDSRLIEGVKGGALGAGGQLVGKMFGLISQKTLPDATRQKALDWLAEYGAKFRPSDISGNWVSKQMDRVLEALPGSNWVYRDIANSQQKGLNAGIEKAIGDTEAGYQQLGNLRPVTIDQSFLDQMAQAPNVVAKVGAGDLPRYALASAESYAGKMAVNPDYVKFVQQMNPAVVKSLGGPAGVKAIAAKMGIPEQIEAKTPLLPLGSQLPVTGPLGATDNLQALRSLYGKNAYQASDRPTADVNGAIRDAFDDMLSRQYGATMMPNGNTVSDFTNDLRQRYGMQKLLQSSSKVTDEGTDYSVVKAANAINKMRREEPAKWNALAPDKQEVLSNIAQLGDALRPAPSSGTAQQRMMQDLIKMVGLGAVGGLTGNELGDMKGGVATAFAAPAILAMLASRRANSGMLGSWANTSPETAQLLSRLLSSGSVGALASP